MISIVAWNVGHQTRHATLRSGFTEVIRALEPDILVLTEYVERKPRHELRDTLTAIGLSHIATTELRPDKHNQVLVAARWAFRPTVLEAPGQPKQVLPNHLQVRIAELDLDVLGMRAPMFKNPDASRQREAYWDWLSEVAATLLPRRSVIVGDFNGSPTSTRRYGPRLAGIISQGWQFVSPSEGASFFGRSGGTGRIDHALVSPSLSAEAPTYVSKLGPWQLAGSPGALSDHAALQFRLDDRP